LREVAKRDGSVLTLKLGNGKAKVISDSKECNDPNQEDMCITRRLVGYIEDRQFIVRVAPYECASLLLINRRTGEETTIGGWPSLSPNKKRFVVTSSAVSGECNPPYGIAIFSLNDEQPRLEWKRNLRENLKISITTDGMVTTMCFCAGSAKESTREFIYS
jgi:hypothetical protein